MLQPPLPSYSAPRPEVISADAHQKWQGPRPGWRPWLIAMLAIAVILALIIILFSMLLK